MSGVLRNRHFSIFQGKRLPGKFTRTTLWKIVMLCYLGLRKRGDVVGRMDATLGTLVVLRVLSEGPASAERLLDVIEDEVGARRDARTLRRYLAALNEAGFEVKRRKDRYELNASPAKLPFDDHETLATLSVLESLAEREPVYGRYLASAVAKLREALPAERIRFADSGRVVFDLVSADDPPEDPRILDLLRRAIHRNQRVEIYYHSLSSGTRTWRMVEPVRLFHAQRAHRLYAYSPEAHDYREFRVNRITEVKFLPDLFSPEAHIRRLEPARVRLDEKTFTAYGRSVIQDPNATSRRLDDGGAIVEGRVASTFWTVRDLASLGPGAEVLGGDRLRQEFLDFLHATAEKYR
ncbi:MAG: WYL domain-containing protein [Rubrobacteraceae bacterium]|nr:WYL domain-containing protein [Rubrobacteraceae bacterium]